MNLQEAIEYVCSKFEDIDKEEIQERIEEIIPIEEDILERDLDLINPEGVITNILVALLPVKDELRS